MMLRNVPEQLTRSELLRLLDDNGFARGYDFVYLPSNFATRENFGYAFVDLVDEETSEKFRERFAGFLGWGRRSDRMAEVARSNHQGLRDHVERYRNSPLMHESVPDELRPALFQDGRRLPFPLPTRRVPAPRIRNVLAIDMRPSP